MKEIHDRTANYHLSILPNYILNRFGKDFNGRREKSFTSQKKLKKKKKCGRRHLKAEISMVCLSTPNEFQVCSGVLKIAKLLGQTGRSSQYQL